MSLPQFQKPANNVGVDPKLVPVNKPIQPLKKGTIRTKWTKNTPENPDANAAFKLGALQEFTDPKSRVSAIKTGDTDKGLKMIFDWTKDRQLQFGEFEDLLVEVFHKVYKNIK